MFASPLLRASALALLVVLTGCLSAQAQTHEAYTQARFEALQAQNALILVDIYAPWCPTCASQQRVIEAYQAAHPDVDLHVLRVDFDNQKPVVRRFRAPRQSTLFLYKGTERVWFAVAETRQAPIFAALNSAASGR